MQERDRKEVLRAFLRESRERLTPEDVGLPSIGRRRVRGLRREEVAQLAGISLAWYTLFETARDIRVSPRALDRLAQALRLNDGEKTYLFSLAIAEIPSVPRSCVDDVGAVGNEYVGLQILTRRLRAASSLQEVEHASIEFLFAHARPELAMFVHADLASKELWFTTQCPGSGIEPQSGQRYSDSMVNDFEPVFERGEVFCDNNIRLSGRDIASERARRFGSGRYIVAGVQAGELVGSVGYIQRSREPFPEREKALIGLIAELTHLALAGRL